MTREELRQAFQIVMSQEFSHIPMDEESCQVTFSEQFLNRMEALFRRQKKFYWSFINTAPKRACVALLALILLFATACSFKPIREPIVEFFTEIYETFTHYWFEGDTVNQIERVYELEPVPAGVVVHNQFVTDKGITTVYVNESGDEIRITQLATEETTLVLDTEKKDFYIEHINGYEVAFHETEGKVSAIWVKDQYGFRVVGSGSVDTETIKQIIQNLK